MNLTRAMVYEGVSGVSDKREGDQCGCKCRNKQNCPLDGKFLESSLVYEAELKTKDSTFNHLGLIEGTIKDRIAKHKISLILKQH